MRRRALLGALGAGTAAGLAGCGLLPCGPGEPPIEEIAANPDQYAGSGEVVEVEGEVQSIDGTGITMIVDDGTGTAKLVAPSGYVFDTEIIDEGECHFDDGRVRDRSSWDTTDADVKIDATRPDR